MLARTRLLLSTPRIACVRSLAQKAASDASKAVSESTTAAGPLSGGEQRHAHRDNRSSQ